jgi:hypothetical protein
MFEDGEKTLYSAMGLIFVFMAALIVYSFHLG